MRFRKGEDGSFHLEVLWSKRLNQPGAFLPDHWTGSNVAQSPDVLFHLCGMKPTIEIDLLHARMRQKFQRVFNQGRIGQREKTLGATTSLVSRGTDLGGRSTYSGTFNGEGGETSFERIG